MSKTGLEGVSVADTRLSRVQGVEGRLSYAGYAIEDLARHASFEEVSHLLWTGELPDPAALDSLQVALVDAARLPGALLAIVRAGATRAHPMTTLQAALAAAAFFDPDAGNSSPGAEWRKAVRLTGHAVAVTAAIGRLRAGLTPLAPRRDLGLAANLLFMLRGAAAPAAHAHVLDKALVLHADHGMNPSTFAARVAAATRADLHAAVVAAIGALKGPLHGGAPEAVMRMLEEIGHPDRARAWVRAALARGERVPGFGHRAYRTVDPRVPILQGLAAGPGRGEAGPGAEHVGSQGNGALWLEIAAAVQAAMAHEMLQHGRPVHPNVDLFSAVVYAGLGIPRELFPALFACARMPGWTAHVMEQRDTNRLFWPEATYVGPADRAFKAKPEGGPAGPAGTP